MLVPSLMELCQQAMAELVKRDGEKRRELLTLPVDLFQDIIYLLSPLTLESIHNQASTMPWLTSGHIELNCQLHLGMKRSFEDLVHNSSMRCLDAAWKQQNRRWQCKPRYGAALSLSETQLLKLSDNEGERDWRQCFWGAYIQECLNEAVAQASTSPPEGPFGDLILSNALLQQLGYEDWDLDCDPSPVRSLKYNCWKYGKYARSLRIRGTLCTRELRSLLGSCSGLQHVVFSHFANTSQVEGAVLLLGQTRGTLRAVEFHHCRFPLGGIEKVHASLVTEDGDSCPLQHFSVLSSQTLFKEDSDLSYFMQFLHASRLLRSLVLIDNQIDLVTSKELLSTIADAMPHLELLRLSENEMEGDSATSIQSMQPSTIFASLKILDIRSNDISRAMVKQFVPYFSCMPFLQKLNLSDNPIYDVGLMAMAQTLRVASLVDLNLSACNLSVDGTCFLFDLLVSLKRPLQSLKISRNHLGRSIVAPLAHFLRSGVVEKLDIGDIALGASGCLDLEKALQEMPNLIDLVIRGNRLGSAGATLLCKLISIPSVLKTIDCSSNLLDTRSLRSIAFFFKVQPTDKQSCVELVDLRNNLAEDLDIFKDIRKPKILLSGVDSAYDDDP